jgi:hypothetical protein
MGLSFEISSEISSLHTVDVKMVYQYKIKTATACMLKQ